ncbi:MAG: hypothetical protein KTR27_07560 [Leptolyngbyaceae cyanobacterium MAG.088]|nr:hypothetical protein [Leptolyngbyaceae cyanobacterium MAG.088]
MANWLKEDVPEGEVVISSPVELKQLPWLSEHPAVIKFLFVPSASSADVEDWFNRITDLGGGIDLLSYVTSYRCSIHHSRGVNRGLQ